ncbi:hypothetical protein ACQQ2N_10345 [Dokdonella sp. MW10]|uniref:hypothetical protein n=1 Tax=Dokdonella sp. MW10 TaxID=2992926 RepID=UPI003F7E9F12
MLPVVALAQTFPVRIERAGNNGVCEGMTANRMSVDPASGRVTLQGVTGMTCLPDGAAGLSTISVNVPTGPHASGITGVTATVQGIPSGANCTLRGVVNTTGSGIVSGAGWADGTTLCTNCGTSANRVLAFDNTSTTAQWKFKLQVQCSLSSGGYAIQSPVIQSAEVTVQPATVAVGDCPYGDQVPTDGHDGLTMAKRQLQVTTTGQHAYNGAGLKDGTAYINLFGAYGGGGVIGGRLIPSPGPVSEGYGHPGIHGSLFGYRINQGEFLALKFRAPRAGEPAFKGLRNQIKPYSTSSVPGTLVSMAVAPCPGQFRSTQISPIPPGCIVNAGQEGASLATVVTVANAPYNGDQCPIEAGKSYYLNIIAVNASTPGSLNPANAQSNWLCTTPTAAWCNADIQRTVLTLDPDYN